jgi:hypothetical protein
MKSVKLSGIATQAKLTVHRLGTPGWIEERRLVFCVIGLLDTFGAAALKDEATWGTENATLARAFRELLDQYGQDDVARIVAGVVEEHEKQQVLRVLKS